MSIVEEITPAFFLTTNKDVYYAWYMPLGRRSKISVVDDGVIHSIDGREKKIIECVTPLDIIGLSLTGYMIPREDHTMEVETPLFIVDTMYDLRDPYTDEEVEQDVCRVTSLRDFIHSFHRFIPGLTLITQTTYGIDLTEWNSRINSIWSMRVKSQYPVVGLIFYSRERNIIYEWNDYPVVDASNGTRPTLRDLGTYNLRVEYRPVPAVVDEYYLSWDDMVGNGFTTILWYMMKEWEIGSRTTFTQDLYRLSEEKKREIANNLVLSVSQLDYLR